MANLHDGLIEEIERYAKLTQIYDDIDRAKEALKSGDVVEMMRCYQALKGCE